MLTEDDNPFADDKKPSPITQRIPRKKKLFSQQGPGQDSQG